MTSSVAEEAVRVDSPVQAEAIRHYPWCDPELCVLDESGVEATVEHRSTPRGLAQLGNSAEIYVAMTRTVWSETQGARRVVLTVPPTTNLDQLRGFCSWLRDELDRIEQITAALPRTSVCPDWCTAETDGDERVRRDHQWHYLTWHGEVGYCRTHWGPVGKTYRTVWESSNRRTGRTELGRMVAGRRIAREAVSA